MTARSELRELRRRVAIRGLKVLDRRTSGAQALLGWRSELIEALGGEEQLSPQIVTLIEQVVRLKLFLDHTDSFLLAMPSIVNSRKKKMVPLVKERLALAAELRATLQLIGLKKIPKLVSSIDPERMEKILAVESEKEGDGQRPESI
jgi:hypothetical protein